jgi:hypothetical protein
MIESDKVPKYSSSTWLVPEHVGAASFGLFAHKSDTRADANNNRKQ